MNLRDRAILIRMNGKENMYSSVREASKETGIAYSTLMNWLNGRSKPRKNIIVEDIEINLFD